MKNGLAPTEHDIHPQPLPNASEAFTKFGETHREMEKHAIKMLKVDSLIRRTMLKNISN
jgi:hypothetical protein